MNTYNNNDIKYTPDFVYTPPSALQPKKETESIMDKYICKFKTAFYSRCSHVAHDGLERTSG